MNIDPLYNSNPVAASLPGVSIAPGSGSGDKSFGQYLTQAIAEVNAAQDRSGSLTMQFAAGKDVDVHDVMIASQEAGIMLNLATQVRNKLVDGFQEVMRIGM